MISIGRLCIIAVLASVASGACAQPMFKCKQPNGSYTFHGVPCDEGTSEQILTTDRHGNLRALPTEKPASERNDVNPPKPVKIKPVDAAKQPVASIPEQPAAAGREAGIAVPATSSVAVADDSKDEASGFPFMKVALGILVLLGGFLRVLYLVKFKHRAGKPELAVAKSESKSAPASPPSSNAAPDAKTSQQSPPVSQAVSQPAVAPSPAGQPEAGLAQLSSMLHDADVLDGAGRIDEAEAAYLGCLKLIESNRFPVTIGLLIATWMGMGFSCANRSDWPGALAWYEKVEECLHELPSMASPEASNAAATPLPRWYRHLPEGVAVLIPKSFDWKRSLANVYDSIAIAYDNNKEPGPAGEYFGRSAALYRKIGDLKREALVWSHRAKCSRRRENWTEMGSAAETMRVTAEEAKDRGDQLSAYRLLALAHMNLQQSKEALHSSAHAVGLAAELKDPGLADDKKRMRRLIAVLRPLMTEKGEAELLNKFESVLEAAPES